MLPSLAAQTNKNFEWVIAVDEMIDAASMASLQRLIAPHPHFKIVTCRPTETYRLYPSIDEMMPAGVGADLLLLSRVDTDDALSSEFVSVLQRAAGNTSAPAVLSLQNGAEVTVADRMIGPVQHRSIAIGVSILSEGPPFEHILNKNHMTLEEWATSVGGAFIAIDAPSIGYLHVRHPDSDSHHQRATRRSCKHPQPIDLPRRFFWSKPAYTPYHIEVSAAVGLAPSWIETVERVRDPALPALPEELPRMASKHFMLTALKEARERGDMNLAKAIRNAIYAL